MIIKNILIILTLTNLVGCASIADQSSNNPQLTGIQNELVGCWKGSQSVINGNHQVWKRCLESDGTYTIKMSSSYETESWENTESGRWAYSNGIYTTVRLEYNGNKRDPLYRDNQGIYWVNDLTTTSMTYFSLRTGNTYTAIRTSN